MNLTKFSIEHGTLINFLVFLVFVGGLFSYTNLGRLEDPDFTVKVGVVITQYPGASPEEVEQEVTDRIERAIQEMPQLDTLYSFSRPGLSIIKVDIKQSFEADRLPQVWDEMRKKVRDVIPALPPGAQKPDIIDDFSFVFGFVLAVTGEGYSYAELESYAEDIQKELNVVTGVSRVDLWGVQPKVVYLDLRETQLAERQITKEEVLATLSLQNMVVNPGSVQVPGQRLRFEVAGTFQSAEEIGDLVIRRSFTDMARAGLLSESRFGRTLDESAPLGSTGAGRSVTDSSAELVRIRDVATVREGYLEPSINRMRYNGKPAVGIQLANVVGGNIIDTGAALDKRLEELKELLPVGVEVDKFTWQSDLVAASVGGFVINLIEAIIIVLIVLAIPMGMRMALVIGWALILTIFATFIAMQLLGIDLQRVSLGALVVALGMMVDNAIVVADNYTVRLAKGMSPKEAAIDSAATPGVALLGATLVAAMAFFPIFIAHSDAGEYARTLFTVVGISLVLSWLVAMCVTPMNCIQFLKPPEQGDDDKDPYDTPFFKKYTSVLEAAIRSRVLTIGAMVGLLVLSAYGFTNIPQQFFPDSTRTQFMVDYWAPAGTPIEDVADGLREVEEHLLADDRVTDIATFVGSGGPRFYLPVDPEFPYAEYAQIIVTTQDFEGLNALTPQLEVWLNENKPTVLTRVRKYVVGSGDTWPFELRITGPADADLDILRRLGAEGVEILRNEPLARHVRVDMRQRLPKVRLDYDQARARWTAISRADVAEATSRAYDGLLAGLYREGNDLWPIIVRSEQDERLRVAGQLGQIQVIPSLQSTNIPLGQVVSDIELEWEDPIITRWQRRRAISVQAMPVSGITLPTLRSAVIDKFEAMDLPPGYEFFWDGEYDSTFRGQSSLIPGIIPAFVIMGIIIVALFNSLKQCAIMVMVVPFALIGITAILLPTQTPFGFMSLLGAMSLVGLMIKNSIVLLDEIEANRTTGMQPYEATIAAGVSRLRPVVLGAATTILGVVPLIQDAFWISMALTMMFGLLFGTMLTMIMVPLFYAVLNKIQPPPAAGSPVSQ